MSLQCDIIVIKLENQIYNLWCIMSFLVLIDNISRILQHKVNTISNDIKINKNIQLIIILQRGKSTSQCFLPSPNSFRREGQEKADHVEISVPPPPPTFLKTPDSGKFLGIAFRVHAVGRRGGGITGRLRQ